MRKTWLTVLFSALVIFGSASISYSGWTVIKLTKDSLNDFVPQINDNGQVVWMGSDGNDNEIFLYDGTAIIQLTTNSDYDGNPQINNSGHVVWMGSDGNDDEIFLYDGTPITQLTNNAYTDIMPKINNNDQVVWLAQGNGSKVYLYDSTTITELTENASPACSIGWLPEINDSGQVVWKGFDGNAQICFYDGTTTIQLTNNTVNSSHGFSFPQINNIGHVVWEEWDGDDYEIFLYDGATVAQLTNNSYDDANPRINDDDEVVWMRNGSQGWEIFLYNGLNTTRLTNNSYVDTFPRINNQGHVVWIGRDGNGDELFVYNGRTIAQLTDNVSGEIYMHPQINDSGQVVWQGWNGQAWNIFTALPPFKLTVLSPNGEEVLTSGFPETIQWTASEQELRFNLFYSIDRGATWNPIATSVTGNSHDWVVPVPNRNETGCLVKVVGYRVSGMKRGADTSDGPFTIEVVKLETPSGPGISMNFGEVYNITWTTHVTANPVETVELYYTQNATVTPVPWRWIASFKPGDYPDGYPWTVPDLTKKKTKCRVKMVLKDANDYKVGGDVSDHNFTIQPSP